MRRFTKIKTRLPESIYNDPQEKQKIYERYLQAFKKGVYNYIKEEKDPLTQQAVPRKFKVYRGRTSKPQRAEQVFTSLEMPQGRSILRTTVKDNYSVESIKDRIGANF